jgi:hypothetical protein
MGVDISSITNSRTPSPLMAYATSPLDQGTKPPTATDGPALQQGSPSGDATEPLTYAAAHGARAVASLLYHE